MDNRYFGVEPSAESWEHSDMKIKHTFVALAVLVMLSSCSSLPETPRQLLQVHSDIIKSPNDDRDYRYLVLANGLKVLLVSDPKADKSAASLSVYRGSFDDPLDRPGLAHFLEHMLFIGTEKYPESDGYFSYIQTNGGSSNAYTASEVTSYFFDVKPESFREGLDRFAQFFIGPLLQKEYVEREKNAVHSEYQLQIKEDGCRWLSAADKNQREMFTRFYEKESTDSEQKISKNKKYSLADVWMYIYGSADKKLKDEKRIHFLEQCQSDEEIFLVKREKYLIY